MSIFKLPLTIAVNSMKKGDENFAATHRTFGNFNTKRDLNYCEDGKREHLLDIYTNPSIRNGILLLYVHGGGYVQGYKEGHKIFCSWFVDQGFDVVSINYRLGKKDGSISIMDQVKDAFYALSFIEENKNYYDLKTDNLFLLGDSAGGHICLMLDILLKNQKAAEYYGIDKKPQVEIKGIALNSTMYDYDFVVEQAKDILYKKGRRWMLSNNYLDSEFIKMNNPRYYYRNGFKPAPLFASTSYHDFFNPQTLRLKKDCDEFGLNLDYLFEASVNKHIGHVYNHFHFETKEGKYCNQRMVEFFIKNSKVAK